jgi:hypothetical protein
MGLEATGRRLVLSNGVVASYPAPPVQKILADYSGVIQLNEGLGVLLSPDEKARLRRLRTKHGVCNRQNTWYSAAGIEDQSRSMSFEIAKRYALIGTAHEARTHQSNPATQSHGSKQAYGKRAASELAVVNVVGKHV